MILIIGGACQGKKKFAQELSGMDEPAFSSNMADGADDCPEDAWKKRFLIGFHQWIRRTLEEGKDPEEFVRQVIKAGMYTSGIRFYWTEIVTMDEVGCGIVPIERAERDYREAAGRAGQMLAGHARQVYRVVCGIPVKIKG